MTTDIKTLKFSLRVANTALDIARSRNENAKSIAILERVQSNFEQQLEEAKSARKSRILKWIRPNKH